MGTRPQFLMEYRTFEDGDAFSETERAKTAVEPKKKDGDIFDSFIPSDDQFKALSKGIDFFKFDPDTAKSLFNAIGSAVNIAAGVVTVIGAYKSAIELLEKVGVLKAAAEVDADVKAILANTQALIDLAGAQMEENRRELVDDWKSAIEAVASARADVAASRTFFVLRNLADRVAELDQALDKMLAFNTANIFFQRAAYQTKHVSYNWTEVTPSAHLDRRDHRDAQGIVSATPDYKNPRAELRERIWDPGHYLPVLVKAIGERLAATAMLEPAFRSTGYNREALRQIERGLTGFVSSWERSLIVANPAAGIDADGFLYQPFYGDAPEGVLIGAVDPVVGYSNLKTFPILPIKYEKSEFIFSASGEGVYDSSQALDPQGALRAAVAAHAQLVDQVIELSGIGNFRKIQKQLDKATRPPRTSDFATVEKISYGLPNIPIGQEETIKLGRLARYAPNPDKIYPATRYVQGGNKQLQFFMPRRGEISGIQLGYALRFTDARNHAVTVELIRFDAMASATAEATPFPTEAITKTIKLELDALDCIQTRMTTTDEEDAYENRGKIKGASRILINPRRKTKHLVVTALFEPEAETDQPNRGIVTVVIDPEDPNTEADAAVLRVELLETRPDANTTQPSAVAVDSFEVTIVPSYLVVPKEMIDDVRKATAQMAKTIDEIRDKFGLDAMIPPDHNNIDPKKFRADRIAIRIEQGIDYIDAKRRLSGIEAEPEIMLYTGALPG